MTEGTYMGCRMTKVCRKCKVYEHHGYWYQNGERYFDSDSLSCDFLLSTEDTTFDMNVLSECGQFLFIGAVPFSTCSANYNRRFKYSKMQSDGNDVVHKGAKRMKRYVGVFYKYIKYINTPVS